MSVIMSGAAALVDQLMRGTHRRTSSEIDMINELMGARARWPRRRRRAPLLFALAACCGFDLCHKYILYLYLYLYFARMLIRMRSAARVVARDMAQREKAARESWRIKARTES